MRLLITEVTGSPVATFTEFMRLADSELSGGLLDSVLSVTRAVLFDTGTATFIALGKGTSPELVAALETINLTKIDQETDDGNLIFITSRVLSGAKEALRAVLNTAN